MMSAAILCTRGVLPDYFIPMALQSPTLFRLPLAPAEGLVLSMAGFHRNSNGQDFSMASVTQSALREILLMTDEEYKASQQFQIDAIHPQILHDWFDKHNKNTSSASTYSKISNEDGEVEEQKSLLEEWRAYAARFTPSDKTLQTWQDLNQASQPDPSLLQEKERREYVRIQRSVQLFHQDAQDVLSVRKKPLSDNQIGQLR